MENLRFQAPSQIYYDVDACHKIGPIVKQAGKRIFLISIASEFRNEDEFAVLRTSLDKHSQGTIFYEDMEKSPDPEAIDTAAHQIKRSCADIIVAYGGYETLNVAKLLAILGNNEIFAEDFIMKKKTHKNPPLPICTIPTVPSMGEEVSPHFAVLSPDHNQRIFFFDERLAPALVYLDPKIYAGLQVEDISRGAVSSLAAGVEAILNKSSNEITNTLALRSLELTYKNLPAIYNDPTNLNALGSIAYASVLSGLSYSNSFLGLCYALSLALHHHSHMDMGFGMGIILPHMMEFYLTASPAKYVQIARFLGESIADISVIEAAIKAVEGVRKLYLEVNFPQRLSDFSISKADLPQIAAMASQYAFLKNTPRPLNRNEIETILIAAY